MAVNTLGNWTRPADMAAVVDPSKLLRSTFFTPSCSSFGPVKNFSFPRRHNLSRKCISQMPSAFPSGLGTELHDSVVQLQVGLLQTAMGAGLPLPAVDGAFNWLAFTVPAVWWYLAATPGSLSGLVDFAYAPVHSVSNISFDADEVQVGRQIGEGSFGIVYEGYIGRGVRKGSQKKELHVILKKVRPNSKGASEMHDAEVYINRRVQRTAPKACADFLGTVNVSSSQSRGRLSEGLWLVWRYEGDRTLAYYMKQKNFPENVAELVLGSKIQAKGTSKQEVAEQNNAVIRKIAVQILENLRDLHKTGLVHRDVKPLNLILAQDSGTFKLVDLGAAVDIRSGFNYVPDETIIDPTYAAPEHHVMPTSTPQLPPDPLCSVVSPVVWLMNTPDRFDLYSAGLILLQMAVKPLRQDISMLQFNSEFKRVGYDLDVWRTRCRFSNEEFSLLDEDGGAGWELVRSMLLRRPDRASFIWPSLGSSRPSAEAALRHRFLSGSSIKIPSFKFPRLPAVSVPLQPGRLIPNLSIPNLDLPTLSAPNLSIPKLDLPNFSTPKLSMGSFSKFGAGETGLGINWEQVNTAISTALPTVITTGLTLGTGWLVFSALRDSAQKSYQVGQSLATAGPLFLASFVLLRFWSEAQEKKQSSSRIDAKFEKPQMSSSEEIDYPTSLEDRAITKSPISQLQHASESFSLSGIDESEETSHHVGLLAAADVETLHQATIEKLLSSRPQTSTRKYVSTGLVEAVQTMELQLASLESSIAAGKLFSQQQQEQIIQMEKLLKQRPKETVTAAKQSG